MFSRLPTEDFDIAVPSKLHPQAEMDECTSIALSYIAEDALGENCDPSWVYNNSSKGTFGITPADAIRSVIEKGVKTESGKIVFPFTDKCRIWWFDMFSECRKKMFSQKRPLFCGIHWQPYWENGICNMGEEWYDFTPHAFMISGQVTKDGIIYLKAWDFSGSWLMPREVVNKLRFAYILK